MKPAGATLSVVVPCYNERATIREILQRIADSAVVNEIVVVDDCSKDGTRELLPRIESEWTRTRPSIRVVYHPQNRGKGAALRTGFAHVTGDLCVVQDADLEYDPLEYPRLMEPILADRADVVYGTRFGGLPRRNYHSWHAFGNRVLTFLSNLATGLRLTDMETCYKMFKSEIIRSIPLRSDRFGFEPEVTAKVAKRRCRVREIPISYRERSYAEGKKIGWRDGIQAIGLILKYRLIDDISMNDPSGSQGSGLRTERLKAGLR